MRSSNWIAAALLLSGLTAFAAQPAWVHEKGNGQIELKDPANQKRTVLTLHAPGKVTVRKIENRCFSIQTDFAGKIIPGVYGIRNGKENSFDFFWKLEGEWTQRIGSGAFVFSLDPSLRGKTLFFLEGNGKQSALFLPQEKNLTRWLRPPFNRKIVQRIDVPLSSGTLRIDGAGCEVACMVYGYNSGDFRLFPKNGYLQGEVTIQYLPLLITPIDISPAANRSFADDVADDGKGGWTDQGKQQDLSQFKEKQLHADGVRFNIAPGEKTCMVLGKRFKGTLAEAKISAGRKSFDWLYLLHAAAWCGKKEEVVGRIEVVYSDGGRQTIPVRNAVDVNNWWGDPKNLENWQRIWSTENKDEMRFGLGMSRFALQDRPVQAFIFHAEGDAMWMIVAATGISGRAIFFAPKQEKEPEEKSFSIAPGKEWKVYRYEHGVIPDSILDFSSLAPTVPAGTYGKVVIRNGHFEFENRPGKAVRFYGTNACFEGTLLPEDLIQYYTRRLKQYGMNALRLHHFDVELVKPGTGIVFDEAKLDRFFRQIAEFKKAGFYITLDLYTGRRQGFPEKYAGISPFEVKILAQFDPEMRENMMDFARGILARKNPYTGMTLAEDPALLSVALMNEVQLIGNRGIRYNSPNRLLREPLNRAYEAWCKKNGVILEKEPKAADWMHFSLDTLREGLAYYRSELRKIGVTAPISQNNNGLPIITAEARRDNDYFDIHYYWAHPNADVGFGWNRNPSSSRLGSSIQEYWESPLMTARHRITGMPSMVTEYHYCAPNMFRAEGGAIGGAFAAWQDFDGIFDFESVKWISRWPDVLGDGQKIIASFGILTDPVNVFSQYIFTCLYLRGDIRPAKDELHLNLPERLWEHPGLNNLWTYNPRNLEKAYPSPAYIRLGVQGKLSLQFKEGEKADNEFSYEDFLTPEVQKDPDSILRKLGGIDSDGWIRTPGGQIAFHPARNLFRAVSERSEALVQDRNMDNEGSLLRVTGNTTFSTVFAGSADHKPLTESGRILILHITDVKPSRDKWATKGNQLHHYSHTPHGTGTYPHLLRIGQATIRLKTPLAKNGKLYAVSQTGKRVAEIPFRKLDDGLEFTADTGRQAGIMAYELVNER